MPTVARLRISVGLITRSGNVISSFNGHECLSISCSPAAFAALHHLVDCSGSLP